MPCTLCPGIAEIASLDECERIIIDGRRTKDGPWTWTIDIITETRDGHANECRLDQAIFTAVSQIR